MSSQIVNLSLILDLTYKGKVRQYNLRWTVVRESDRKVPPEDGTLHFTSSKVLHMGNSQVFRGTLTFGEKVYPSDVVCKVVVGEIARLRSEAELYTTSLKDVQGFLVPRFIDYFVGISPVTGREVACILLEYAGTSLRARRWSDVPMDMRSKAIDILIRLHRLGIYHNDFFPRHVVVDSRGRPRIIDFDNAELHECHVANRDFRLYEYEPLLAELDCAEVYETSVEMDIWTPFYVSFMGTTVDMRDIKDVTDLVKLVRSRKTYLTQYSDEQMARAAWRFLKWYDDHYLSRIRPAKSSTVDAGLVSTEADGPETTKTSDT